MFFVRYVFFPNTAMSGCKPSIYRSIVFLKSWICRTGSDSMSVSSRDSIWMYLGQYVDICLFFFQHDVEKILVFYGYIQIWWEIWQYLWPDLGTWSRLPIYSTSGWNSSFGDCRRMSEPGVVKGIVTTLHNQKPKYAIEQKKTSVTKKLSIRFSRYIYPQSDHVDETSSAIPTAPAGAPGGRAPGSPLAQWREVSGEGHGRLRAAPGRKFGEICWGDWMERWTFVWGICGNFMGIYRHPMGFYGIRTDDLLIKCVNGNKKNVEGRNITHVELSIGLKHQT